MSKFIVHEVYLLLRCTWTLERADTDTVPHRYRKVNGPYEVHSAYGDREDAAEALRFYLKDDDRGGLINSSYTIQAVTVEDKAPSSEEIEA